MARFVKLVAGQNWAKSAAALCLCVLILTGAPAAASTIPNRLIVPGLEEPLVAEDGTSGGDLADLSKALKAYRARLNEDDVGALQGFVTEHPASAWDLALLLNIGLSDYHYGYFSRAITDFQRAWAAGQSAKDPHVKALADRAGGELLRMHARLGHAEELTSLLTNMQTRGLSGPASEMRDGAKEGLWLMHNQPGVAFLCGPMALKNLLTTEGRPASDMSFLDAYQSSPRGVSLAEVGRLADQAKLPHTLIHRDPGDPIPVPSVVHWKVNHFAAVVGQQGGRFHLMDPTFGDSLWVSRAALNSEGSGYFLVPSSAKSAAGWRTISSDEAAHVFGMGTTANSQGNNLTGGSPGATCPLSSSPNDVTDACTPTAANGPTDNSGSGGMTRYGFKEMLVSLNLTDTPVGYVPPKGPPVRVQVSYNQREQNQPSTFSFFNVSPKWTLNWLSYVQDDPNAPGSDIIRYVPGGGASLPVGYNSTTHTFATDVQDASTLTLVTGPSPGYERTLKDGSVESYGLSNGATTYPRLFFLTQLTDPYGNIVTLNYDSMFRLTSIVDATNRSTTFAYTNNSDPLLVTKITDPFGRYATLAYDGSGRLSQITDVLGLVSKFTYDSSSLVNSLSTPYGTTQFSYGENGNARFVQATDPLGYTDRLEYVQGAPGISSSDPSNTVPPGIVSPFNAYLNQRDTFYWDKHAYAVGAGNYSKARNRHWAHLISNTTFTSDTIESVKYPLEARVWFNHPGQTGGAGISGSYEQPTNAARVLDDGTQQLTQTQYLANGNISSFTDEAGRQTQLVYAPNQIDVETVQQLTASGLANVAQFTYTGTPHCPTTYTDASGQTTQFTCNPAGQVTKVIDALGNSTVYNYNTLGYLTSIVNADGKTAYSFGYDSFGRVSASTDSQGWTVKFTYDAMDRLKTETFPDKSTRTFNYTYLDLTSVTDRQGRTTQAFYDKNRNLIMITDPLNETTQFGRYEDGSLKSLTDPNGNTTTWTRDLESRVTSKIYADGKGMGYGYEAATSRLLFTADMMNQIRQFSYTADNKLAGIRHLNAVNPTPNVAFKYDPYFPLLTTMQDGTGTTTYQYGALGGLGALQVAQEAPPVTAGAIAYGYDALGRLSQRIVGGNVEKFTYDKIGRLASHMSDLGTFQRTYLGETAQLTKQTNGTFSTSWTYDINTNDRRLLSVATPGGTSYGLTTTAENDLMTLTDSTNNLSWTYTYDKADRLKTGQSSTNLAYGFTYDAGSNLGPIQRPSGTTGIASNSVNQVSTSNGVAFAYDANGNLIKDYARTYAWDADNRLIAVGIIGQAGLMTTFRYDGMNRRVAIDTTSSGTTSETQYQWCGTMPCQARASEGTVARRYFAEGEEAFSLGQSFYYGVDQIGSVRDALLMSTGGVAAHYDYDPYGKQTNISPPTTDFRYGGLFFSQQTGLYLATFRIYDSLTARWISRDPIAEKGGLNLYGYITDNVLIQSDPLGLCPPDRCKTLKKQIYDKADDLQDRLRSYDPLEDSKGGFRMFWGSGRTSPGGHYQKITELQRGIKNDTSEYRRLGCDDDDDPDNTGQLPRWIDDMANRPVEMPPNQNAPTFPSSSAPSLPWWAPVIPLIPILRLLPLMAAG